MQFLIGLNEGFEQARSQILMQDPLPSINKAYSVILKVEAQRKVFNNNNDMTGSRALQAQTQYTMKDYKKRR